MVDRIIKCLLLFVLMLSSHDAQAEQLKPKYEWKRVKVFPFDVSYDPSIDLKYARLKGLSEETEEQIHMLDFEQKLKELCDLGDPSGCWHLKSYPQKYEADKLCNDLAIELNSYEYPKKEDALSCGLQVVSNYKGFKEPEGKRLFPINHIPLLYNLEFYGKSGNMSSKTSNILGSSKEYHLWNRIINFINKGKGELFYWTASLPKDFHDYHGEKPTVDGTAPLHLLTMRIYGSKKTDYGDACSPDTPNTPEKAWGHALTYLVSKDLQTPDLRLSDPLWKLGKLQKMHGEFFKLYKNNIYIITTTSNSLNSIAINSFDLRYTSVFNHFCEISYRPIQNKGK